MRSRIRRSSRLVTGLAASTATLLALTGCAALGGEPDSNASKTVVVATHDSWNMPDDLIAQFEEQTGLTVRIQPQGDAGQLTNKLVLTKDDPIADMEYGVDNTFASRAVDNGVLQDADVDTPPSVDAHRLDGAGHDQLVPIDYSDVCVNVDDTWFAEHHRTPPRTLADLTRPAYRGLFVTPGASSSSPGMAFLLATIARYGDQWPSYWRKLMANETLVTSGWTDAYEVDFTGGGGKHGTRPIVLSYSSSPPFTIPEGATRPTTSALLDTCFRQVEYAGVLAGAANPAGARKFIEFMTQRRFQSALPDNMYVYPVLDSAEVPEDWSRWAPTAPDPYQVPADEVAANRSRWLTTWRDIVTG
ncbi:MAG TPA: thiamine ABC transporter substrate-binding protein [Marmoricola sp.]|nr:thiamine ABC transporter substrate-binding protein [Marmoricola sp.]